MRRRRRGAGYWALYVIALPHELCHYLMARLLGIDARIGSGYTSVGPGRGWKRLLVTLAPALVGMGAVFVTALYSGFFPACHSWFECAAMAVAFFFWMASCRTDLSQAWHWLRRAAT